MSWTKVVIAAMSAAVLLAGCSSGGSGDSAGATAPDGGPALDGTYVFEFDVAKRTQLGAPAPRQEPLTAKWAIRSHCVDAGCTATATRLHMNGKPADTRTTLDFLDGKWVMVFAEDSKCNAGGQPARVLGTWVLEPKANNVLSGVWTEITMGQDCPWVVQMPVVVTRQSDVAPDVPVSDPAGIEARRPSKPEGFQGVYNQTITTQPPDGQPATLPIKIDTFCVRNTDECASIQSTKIENKPQITPLTFAGDRWVYRWDRSGRTCPDGAPSTGFGFDEVFFPEASPNPLPRLTGTRRLDIGDPCPTQQLFDLVYERNNAPAPAPGG